MGYLQLVELAPYMRPAGRFLDGSALIKMMKARISIRLQSAAEPAQMLARMFAFPIGRVGEPYRGGCFIARWAIIPDIGPQSSSLGLAVTRRQHRNRRVIGM